jgi:NAD(P)-dependent dehydrogenase (short-subunit alcohol dehydrogenase family)
LREVPQATVVPLDVTDSPRCASSPARSAAKVDILVNTADCHRTSAIGARGGVDAAQLEMDVNYFGLLRLAQEFAPLLKARAADGPANAIAWVNVLSIFALSNYPPHGTYSASKAAALSLSQALRASCGRPACGSSMFFPARSMTSGTSWNAAETFAKRVGQCAGRRA